MGIAAVAETDNWKMAAREYRMLLFGKGAAHKHRAAVISQQQMVEVMRSRGRLPRAVLLRCRVRYFSDGAILGSKDFVRQVFESQREHFGLRTQRFGRPLPGADWQGLVSFRQLRNQTISLHSAKSMTSSCAVALPTMLSDSSEPIRKSQKRSFLAV